jgi:hypothetical protein
LRGMEPREIAIAQARGRIAVGAAFVLAPGLAARSWVGRDASRRSTKVVSRAFGVRDLALGLGVVIAIDRGTPVRGWLEASALSDAVDFCATLLGGDAVPRVTRPGVLALGAGSGAVAGWLSRTLDSDGQALGGMTPEAAVTGHPEQQPA